MPNQPPTSNQPFNPQQGSGFVNLSQFLNANQGNKLGSTLSGDISNAAQNNKQGLGTANQAFSNDLQSNTLNTSNNQQQATNIINEASNLNPNQGLSAGDTSAFERLSAGGYNGPTGLANATQLQNQAKQVQQYGQAVGNQYGRLGLLSNLIGKGNNNYTQGDATLDNMLLGNSSGLQQAQRQTRGLVNNVNNAVNTAGQQAQNVAQQNKQFGQNVLGQANTAYQNYGSNLNQRAQQEQADQALAYQTDVNALNNRQIIGGITPGTATYGVNPLQYLSQIDPSQITAQTIANDSDVARLNALSNLAQTPNNIANQISANQYDPTKGVSFNTGAFNQAVANQQANYQQALANTNVVFPNSGGAYGGTINIIGPGQSSGGNPTQNIVQALPQLAQQAAQARQAIAAGEDPQSSGAQQMIDTYNQAVAAYQSLQQQYGATDYFGPPPKQMVIGGGTLPGNRPPGFSVPS